MIPVLEVYANGYLMVTLPEPQYNMRTACAYGRTNFEGRIDIVPGLRVA